MLGEQRLVGWQAAAVLCGAPWLLRTHIEHRGLFQ